MENQNPQEEDRVRHMKTIEKKETWCDSCGKLVPEEDIYYVTGAGKQKVERVCKNCLSFVKKLRGINYEGRTRAKKEMNND